MTRIRSTERSTFQPEYLTTREVAERLRLRPKRVLALVASGTFREGRHYVRPPGIRIRFIWPRIEAWLQGDDEDRDAIPMARTHRRRMIYPDSIRRT